MPDSQLGMHGASERPTTARKLETQERYIYARYSCSSYLHCLSIAWQRPPCTVPIGCERSREVGNWRLYQGQRACCGRSWSSKGH